MLIQKNDILCSYVLHKSVERVNYIVEHPKEFYTEFHRFKTDKLGNKKVNKPQYKEKFGELWTRVINPPRDELKEIQKRINKYLVDNIQMPEYAFGGIKSRDNIRNARFHKGQKYVFQTDLKDFFPYITHKKVYEMFVKVGFSHDVSSMLTKLTTYNGHLPQGAPTSTTIANLVFMPTGQALQSIAKREGLRFTTFVDDVTMSSQTDFKYVVPEIIETITSSGFKISQGKTTYKSGITDITGVRMLNNSLTVTDKFIATIEKEVDKSSPRTKGLLNYKERIKILSKSKNNMQEFRFEDKERKVSFRGVVSHNDKNCPPLLFFRLILAYYMEKLFSDKVKASGLKPMPEYESRMFVLKQVDDQIINVLTTSSPNPIIHEILTNGSLSFKKQRRLLKGLKLFTPDTLWLYKEAQDLGYLMDTTLVETHPVKFDEKKKPLFFYQNRDGSMDVIGNTDMTEGEMRAYLEQRKVVQVRIFHNSEHWHCFYYTFKGMAGMEHGEMGGQSHYHYLSDKSGITWEQLQQRIEKCDMPSSDVHIIVNNRWLK